MPLPTNAEIDEAVPAGGVPDRAKTNAVLKALAGAITPQAAPTITINDPVDDENVQASFDALINALKAAGVFK